MKAIQYLLIALMLTSPATQATDLKPEIPALFTAHFELYKSGIPVANTTYQLSKKDNYYFQSTTKLKGLFSLFSDEEITEKSSFQITSTDYYPVNYSFQQTGENPLSVSSTTNLKDKTISTTINNQAPVKITFDEVPWDKLSILLALMNSAKDQDSTLSFDVLDRGQIKNYSFSYAGIEEIELEEDEWKKTVLWKRQDKNKETIFFLDPERHYIPVKIEQFKNHKLNATLWLQQLIWN